MRPDGMDALIAVDSGDEQQDFLPPFPMGFALNGDRGHLASLASKERTAVGSDHPRHLAAGWPEIEASRHAQNTINPIRKIVDVMNVQPNPEKPLLKLHIGDPTITGVLPTHPNVNKAVMDALMSGKYNGYGPAIGFPEVRQALADYLSTDGHMISAEDIILTSGCSHALQMAIEALANPGSNILVPRPGFPLYVTLMHPHDIEERYYNLRMDDNWQADLAHMASLIDVNTAAIVVNNPNNPTGAVYTREHLEDILKLAQKFRVPVIADEIYGDMVFGGAQFHPMHTLSPKVPMLTCDGISKRYLVPGWRLGWLIIHDVDESLSKVRLACRQLAQKIVGPCALMQGALPAILNQTPKEFFQHTRDVLSENVNLVCQELQGTPGVTPLKAQGAMYMMLAVDIRSFPEFDNNELDMIKALIKEESLYCLPGTAFNYPGAVRLVTTHSAETMREACKRLKAFCNRHYRQARKIEAPKSWDTQSICTLSNKLLGMRKSLLSASRNPGFRSQVHNEANDRPGDNCVSVSISAQ